MHRLLFVLSLLLMSGAASGRELRAGLVIPQTGSFAVFGAHARESFTAWKLANPGILADIVEGDDDCSEKGGRDAAMAMTEAAVDIVVGFVCTESLAAALPLLTEVNIPVLALSVRADILGEEAVRLGWQFFRLAPRAGEEAEIAADMIYRLWADKSFAIIEDGTIEGRELAESIRGMLEDRGLKAAFTDNFRPGQPRQPSLVRRLKSAGVTRVFIGGTRSDIAVIAHDAREQGVEFSIMAGDALNAAAGELPLPDGTLAILSSASLAGDASRIAEANLARLGLHAEGLRIPAYAAADILGAIASRLQYSDLPVRDILASQKFDTALGAISFTNRGERREPGFTLAVWRDGRFSRVSPQQVLQPQTGSP